MNDKYDLEIERLKVINETIKLLSELFKTQTNTSRLDWVQLKISELISEIGMMKIK